MKIKIPFLIVAAVTALAFTSFGQGITNVIKVSQLPISNPIQGTEIVPIVQSGSTVQATINQITAAATAMATVASNYLAAAIGTNVANTVVVSNNANSFAATALSQIQATNAALLAQMALSNAVMLASITGTNAAIRLAMTASNNVVFNALSLTNAIIQGEIAGLGGGITSGSSPMFGKVTLTGLFTTSTNLGSLSVIGNATTPTIENVDLSQWQIQSLPLTPSGSGVTVAFLPQNPIEGENVTLVCTIPAGYSINIYVSVATVAGFPVVPSRAFAQGVNNYEYGTSISGTFILNFQVLQGKIYVSYAAY